MVHEFYRNYLLEIHTHALRDILDSLRSVDAIGFSGPVALVCLVRF
jgi:hypothetical protein